ncbi:MAG TPA: amidohydrolase family protein [Bryobacteraceae bacterium]|jgi:L-fuconolactonase|nr:amidohydrolase family protein [Bryobacteraceae bacterium]
MYKIDSHHHFWKYDPVEYDWITDEMATIRRDFKPADLRLETEKTGISGVISVQARESVDETLALLTYANANDFIKGVVGWVPLNDPNVSDVIGKLALNRKLRGVRHLLQGEPDPDYMLRKDFNRGIATLRQFGLTYDVLIYERQMPQTIQFVDRHPDQIFVLDHFGKPRVKARELSPWRERMFELAKRPNVHCKLSGLVTEADYHGWTEQQLAPYFDVALQAFGPERLMFGSDWPVCLVATTYANWVRIVAKHCSGLSPSEQERIWSGTAIKAYGLS